MNGQKQLSGLLVLIVEDSFLLAEEARQNLEQAGAEVMGPCRDLASARSLVNQKTPDCAVLDVNLGNGPDFTAAREMHERNVGVLFVTGYDGVVFPPDLEQVRCLQKPTSGPQLVSAVAELCNRWVDIATTVITADGAVVTLRNTANAVIWVEGGNVSELDHDTTTVTTTSAALLTITVQY